MPYTFAVTQPAAGDTNVFPVPFPYLRRSHVHGYVNGVEYGLTFLSDGTVQFPQSPAALAGKAVVVRRITPSLDPLVVFGSGSLDNADLNALGKQAVYVAQETRDITPQLNPSLRYDALGFTLANVADPVLDQDAANKRWATDLVTEVTQGLSGQTIFVFVQRDPSADDPTVKPTFFIYKQATPSTSWDIVHNLGNYPQAAVYGADGSSILIPPTHISPNELRLNFADPTAGVAYVS